MFYSQSAGCRSAPAKAGCISVRRHRKYGGHDDQIPARIAWGRSGRLRDARCMLPKPWRPAARPAHSRTCELRPGCPRAGHPRSPTCPSWRADPPQRSRQPICIDQIYRGLAEAGIEPSVGSVGDSYDNALAETINGLYEAESIHRRGPWRSFGAVEYATLEWVDWFNNRRLLEPIGNNPARRSRGPILHHAGRRLMAVT